MGLALRQSAGRDPAFAVPFDAAGRALRHAEGRSVPNNSPSCTLFTMQTASPYFSPKRQVSVFFSGSALVDEFRWDGGESNCDRHLTHLVSSCAAEHSPTYIVRGATGSLMNE
jgi:hypothetical protein